MPLISWVAAAIDWCSRKSEWAAAAIGVGACGEGNANRIIIDWVNSYLYAIAGNGQCACFLADHFAGDDIIIIELISQEI